MLNKKRISLILLIILSNFHKAFAIKILFKKLKNVSNKYKHNVKYFLRKLN